MANARDKWDPHRGPFGAIAPLYIREALAITLHEGQRQDGTSWAETNVGRRAHARGDAVNKPGSSYKLVSAAQTGPDGGEHSLLDAIADETPLQEDTLCDRQEASLLRERLLDAMNCLTKRERQVIKARYMSGQEPTMGPVAKRMRVTRARVQQLEASAIRKLRCVLELARKGEAAS